ncbi:Uncharacterised protein [Veillonella criceti]|uniref:Uncharacterized protein n=1 Tax=Veillonella criceti TaxID=103891 RepID=A0A380NNI9_9FIRM|nr:Uncharacterised protein [Veillonella criceti]
MEESSLIVCCHTKLFTETIMYSTTNDIICKIKSHYMIYLFSQISTRRLSARP